MREKDIKILWGRSGNRCAICKLELTPDGSQETLGEIAHIIARSPDGPRGDQALYNTDLDAYENLILLCPTHHTEIDKCADVWSVERLHTIKAEHEQWVSEQLSTGGIQIAPIDNSAFLEERLNQWVALSRNHVAMCLSITPLRVSGDALDPLSPEVVNLIESAQVFAGTGAVDKVNSYKTRPTEHGLANEDLPDSGNSYGHSLQVFRVGHSEYFVELGMYVDDITQYIKAKQIDLHGSTRVLRYTDIAEIAEKGLNWLSSVWKTALPFNYMTFTGILVNIDKTILYSREHDFKGGIFGFPVNSPFIKYSEIVSKDSDNAVILLQLLQRLVNSYGMVLEQVHDDSGNYLRPERMR